MPDKRLVDILAYTLMPNHIHIVLQEIGIGGISKFMQKLLPHTRCISTRNMTTQERFLRVSSRQSWWIMKHIFDGYFHILILIKLRL